MRSGSRNPRKSFFSKLTDALGFTTPQSPAPPSLTAAEYEEKRLTDLRARIARVKAGLVNARKAPHGRQGCFYTLQRTIDDLEAQLAVLERADEDALLARLKAAVAEIERKQTERT